MYAMRISSSAIQANKYILPKYTCDGENCNPSLSFGGVPGEAKSLAMIMDDPDAPNGTFAHWVLYDIPPNMLQISENIETLPRGKIGHNGFGHKRYDGPCPSSGIHHYYFRLFALDVETAGLLEGATSSQLQTAIRDHIIDTAEAIGLYKKQ